MAPYNSYYQIEHFQYSHNHDSESPGRILYGDALLCRADSTRTLLRYAINLNTTQLFLPVCMCVRRDLPPRHLSTALLAMLAVLYSTDRQTDRQVHASINLDILE